MICKNCRQGAAAVRRVRETRIPERDPHGQCRGGTWCDCQHKLPASQGDVPATYAATGLTANAANGSGTPGGSHKMT